MLETLNFNNYTTKKVGSKLFFAPSLPLGIRITQMLGAQRKWINGWTDKVIYRVAVNLKKENFMVLYGI